jgi:hypothetical protein
VGQAEELLFPAFTQVALRVDQNQSRSGEGH